MSHWELACFDQEIIEYQIYTKVFLSLKIYSEK